jgi:hypothetical protein
VSFPILQSCLCQDSVSLLPSLLVPLSVPALPTTRSDLVQHTNFDKKELQQVSCLAAADARSFVDCFFGSGTKDSSRTAPLAVSTRPSLRGFTNSSSLSGILQHLLSMSSSEQSFIPLDRKHASDSPACLVYSTRTGTAASTSKSLSLLSALPVGASWTKS